MASLSKLTNAFLSASQETTFTLANLNFNFALIKYDAPEEYRALGESLSSHRRKAAEDGAIHIAARKLTALFQSVIPPVPKLIQAYGLRVSEIAKLPTVNPKGTLKQGIFADHVGADGTSIWASATSGSEAVTMHLLACMLARIWKREEAIAIWTEFVQQRKMYLQSAITECDGPMKISDLAASHIELTRTELDEWDASARSWLQTADEGQRLRQTQLRLIIDNISMPVWTGGNIYSAILEAWTSAMETMENLIKGAPHHISNGAILLGLSAWHLYPDMFFAGTNQYINQSDPLVNPGGLMSIGLTNKVDDGKGVFWSLPLTQTRYYGEPLIATRHAGVGESQVPFDNFILVVVGGVLCSWKLSGLDIDNALELIKYIGNASRPSKLAGTEQEKPAFRNWNGHDWVKWLSLFTTAIDHYTQSTGIEKQSLTRLIRFGQRNCSEFLASQQHHPAPAFGLTSFSSLLKSFDADIEARISFIRNWAIRELDPRAASVAVIRYRQSQWTKYYNTSVGVDPESEPPAKKQRLGSNLGINSARGKGIRWSEDDDEQFMTADFLDSSEEQVKELVSIPPRPGAQQVPHFFICGDTETAIYLPSNQNLAQPVRKNCMGALQLYRCINAADINESHIVKALEEVSLSNPLGGNGSYFESLCAIGVASEIYSGLPGARVDLQVTRMQMSKSKWWQSVKSLGPLESMELWTSMCCIAFFDTGTIDLNPEDLGYHSFAVCHANSIFVGSRLLRDPIDEVPHYSIERVIGNVGKPGLTFLITPPDPMVQDFDPSLWHLIAHEKFDGLAQDSFQGTSFHLSFTGYEQSLNVGQRSVRDVPARLLETAVRVYDRGKWVADLDILEASTHWMRAAKQSCSHLDDTQKSVPNLDLVSIDSWLELLDPPQEGQDSVVRAHGNPTARIATAALARQKGRKVVILPEKVCWDCQKLRVVGTELFWESNNDFTKLRNDLNNPNSVNLEDGLLSDVDSENEEEEEEEEGEEKYVVPGAFLIY
ncbi:hypothetical protein V8C42DRAFT_322840 [Trichoderma barbatum]